MNRRSNAWVWVAAAVTASVVVAIAVIAVASDFDRGLRSAVSAVARVAFVPFWLSYTGGAFVALGFRSLAPARNNARELGLAFAAAIAIHVGLIGWQTMRGYPPAPQVVVIFGAAVLLTLLLSAVSFPALVRRIPSAALARFRALATTYIALVYLLDFAIRPQPGVLHYWIAYFPFAALDLLGLAARALVWLRGIREPWRGRAPAR
jgi:hypothetical protein